jgi:hypothetical protein
LAINSPRNMHVEEDKILLLKRFFFSFKKQKNEGKGNAMRDVPSAFSTVQDI